MNAVEHSRMSGCEMVFKDYQPRKELEYFFSLMFNQHLLLAHVLNEIPHIEENIKRLRNETRVPKQIADRLRRVHEDVYQKLTNGFYDKTKGPEYFYKALLKLHREIHLSEDEFDMLFP